MQGKTINGFTLQRLLGVGGMAEVWYAENEIGKSAAVKILNEDLSHNAQIVERFRNEAVVMVKLDHPNIRQVYGYGIIGQRPAIIMEYLEGNDLRSLLKQGRRFPEADLRRWWNQVADALNYTHAEGIIHRDIKPSNLFLDRKGNIKLLDFGIAKVRESISMTQTGAAMGTLMYMSPEQVDDAKHLGAESDIYSLAVTFVHLMTGKAPYDSTNLSDFKIRESIVYKPLDLSGVPTDWQGFLAPYLAKDPSERPALRPFEAGGIKTTVTTKTNGTIETTETTGGIKTTGTTKTTETTDDEGTLMDVPSVMTEPIMPETKKPKTKKPKKAEPKPSLKTEPKQDNNKKNDNKLDTDKFKNRKWLWIGLGIAAVVALALLLLPKPKDTSVKQPTKSDEEGQVEFLFGIADGHQFVDLDLPSGTMWATCNVGADNPEDYGDYYAWGETTTKKTYSLDTYKYGNGDYYKLTKYCNKSDHGNNGFTDNLTTLQSGDDPTAANWGGGWYTPTKEQWEELLNNTTNKWTTQNSVEGRLFTSKTNGQSLFLPATGGRWYDELNSTGSGVYWSRSLDTDDPSQAWGLDFNSNGFYIDSYYRDLGFSVRPVREK